MLQAAARFQVLRVLPPLEAQREVGGVGGIERRVLSLSLLASAPTRVAEDIYILAAQEVMNGSGHVGCTAHSLESKT